MPNRLIVDLDGLDGLAQRLRQIKDDLGAARRQFNGHGDAVGDSRVNLALEDFEEHWRDGRRKVSENVEALATMAAESVKAYRAVDRELDVEIGEAGQQLAAARRQPPLDGQTLAPPAGP
jgi:hypothetical protein